MMSKCLRCVKLVTQQNVKQKYFPLALTCRPLARERGFGCERNAITGAEDATVPAALVAAGGCARLVNKAKNDKCNAAGSAEGKREREAAVKRGEEKITESTISQRFHSTFVSLFFVKIPF